MPGNGVPVAEKKEGEEGGSGKQQLVRLGEKRGEQMASRSPAGQGLHGIRIAAPWKTE